MNAHVYTYENSDYPFVYKKTLHEVFDFELPSFAIRAKKAM